MLNARMLNAETVGETPTSVPLSTTGMAPFSAFSIQHSLYTPPMVRYVASIFAGLILIYIWMTTAHSFVWWIGGADFLYAEGTRMESVPWSIVSVIIWLTAGVVGGFVSALVARHPSNLPSKVLGVLVAVLMGYGALTYLRVGPPALPEGIDPMTFEGIQFAIKPAWFLFTVAVASALGVFAGSWLVGDMTDGEIQGTESSL